jgi:hypothetical protein
MWILFAALAGVTAVSLVIYNHRVMANGVVKTSA